MYHLCGSPLGHASGGIWQLTTQPLWQRRFPPRKLTYEKQQHMLSLHSMNLIWDYLIYIVIRKIIRREYISFPVEKYVSKYDHVAWLWSGEADDAQQQEADRRAVAAAANMSYKKRKYCVREDDSDRGSLIDSDDSDHLMTGEHLYVCSNSQDI